jgi:hypothetical protein
MLPRSAASVSPHEHLSLDANWKFHLGDDWPNALSPPGPRLIGRAPLLLVLVLSLLNPTSSFAQPTLATATVTVTDDGIGSKISPFFMGLSYEMTLVLTHNGKYYIDANDKALVNIFRT